ncbi:MAG TPA: CPBP family intramembrane glutamic endopeptidase [Ktedonobacterales bacterium]|nr:CPBP family intramembrane glutamic endopeptidase [Ktedonobacterales bacterium]
MAQSQQLISAKSRTRDAETMTTDARANRPFDDSREDSSTHGDLPGASGPADAVPAISAPGTAREAAWLARFDAAIPRNTVADTWNWAWKDTVLRVLPFTVGAGLYARLNGHGLTDIGITREQWWRETLIGIAVGIPLAGLAAVFRGWVAPGYRLPTNADQLAQTFFYFVVNAPGEELFWRGSVQEAVVRGLARVPRMRRVAGLLGWLATTAAFGAYHRLGKWSWRSIAGVTFAGAIFGALYQWPRGKRSILAPTIAHGFATAGFLSWADVYLYLRQRRGYLALLRARNEDEQATSSHASGD